MRLKETPINTYKCGDLNMQFIIIGILSTLNRLKINKPLELVYNIFVFFQSLEDVLEEDVFFNKFDPFIPFL